MIKSNVSRCFSCHIWTTLKYSRIIFPLLCKSPFASSVPWCEPSIISSAEALRITNLGFPSAFYHKVSDPIFLLLQRNGDIIGVHSRTPMISQFFIRKIDGVLFISFLRQKNQSLHLSSIVCTTCTHGRPISARVSVQVPKESRKQNKCQQPTTYRVWLQASVNLMIHEKATQLDTGQTSPKMFLNILKKSIPGCASWIFKIFSEFWNFLHLKLSRSSCVGTLTLGSYCF